MTGKNQQKEQAYELDRVAVHRCLFRILFRHIPQVAIAPDNNDLILYRQENLCLNRESHLHKPVAHVCDNVA